GGTTPAFPAQAEGCLPVRESGCPQVVVIGVAGLRWDDIGPDTPALRRLATGGAVGVLSIKAVPALTCRAEGWLTLGAGARARSDVESPQVCDRALPPVSERLRRLNADSRDEAVLGALSDALDGAVAVDGAGAELAGLSESAAAAPTPVLRLVDAGALSTGPGRRAELRSADAAVERALAGVPAGADVLVVGLAESDGAHAPGLHPAMASGPSFPRGGLVSASTRRDSYVQLVDVAPTVLSLVGRTVPEAMSGQPWRVSGQALSLAELVDLDRRAAAQREATVPFFVVAYAGTLALLVLALALRRRQAAELVALTGTALLGASYLANLAPWWRAPLPLAALLGVVVPLSVVVAAVAMRLGRSTVGQPLPARPAALVCGFVAAVLLGDLVTGATLQLDSVAGYSSLVAGRFAGIGNVAFGVLAASLLLAVATLLRRLPVLVAVGVVAVVVDGAPRWGSDVGGVLALVPALTLLVLLRTGRRVTPLRLLAAALAGAAVVTAFALLDLARPAQDRTHLGRFAQDVADGTAGQLLQRKAEAVFGLLFANPVTALMPLMVAAAVYLVVRPPEPLRLAFEASPSWRHGLTAVGLASLIGFAVNDSGAAVPALATAVALPATLAVVLRTPRARLSVPRADPTHRVGVPPTAPSPGPVA
ncbi:MAG: hypothetical protein JWN88_322, partial [Frankiales bacterium]|nr:hypothetical protein [Frankiales bacterium]